jgi:DNA-binding PadR family transcriptional regulator
LYSLFKSIALSIEFPYWVLEKNFWNGDRVMIKASLQKEASTKLVKGLLDMIILHLLDGESRHGYQIISKIRSTFGVYFGASSIYPLLSTLEKKGYIESSWDMNYERPRKMYRLTANGQSILSYTEESLNMICRKMTTSSIEAASDKSPPLIIEETHPC